MSYYEANKEKIRARTKARYSRSDVRAEYRTMRTDPNYRERQAVSRRKYESKKLGFHFTIKHSDLTWPTHCPILGIPLSWEGHVDNTPSIDRINSTLGYVPGNVQVISARANRIKNDGTLDELIALGKWAEQQKA